MQEHIHIQEIITSLIYNVNPHQSNAALSFPASEQEKEHTTLCMFSFCMLSPILYFEVAIQSFRIIFFND